MVDADADIVRGFEDCTLSAASFRHRDHLLVGWTYLRGLSFADAGARFSANLRRFANSHGAETKYHETITWAYLALLAERMHESPGLSFEALLTKNQDLLDHESGALVARYDAATLASPAARVVFVLPRRER
jgi:hypothetical protein